MSRFIETSETYEYENAPEIHDAPLHSCPHPALAAVSHSKERILVSALCRIDPCPHTRTTTRKSSRLGKRLLGSFISVFVGWATCVLGWGLLLFITSCVQKSQPVLVAIGQIPVFCLYVAGVCGIFVLPTWAFVFVWVYLFTPRHSCLWKPWLCVPLGAVAGTAILILFGIAYGEPPHRLLSSEALITILSSAVTGGATCLYASLTAHRYHGETP